MPLPHEPRPVLQVSPTARLLIASQAPGTKVHVSGRPFTDASGDRLRQWLAIGPEIFYDASRVAIVPMGMCFPGQDAKGADLPPRRECAGLWRDRLMQQLPRIELILAVGQHAQAWHLRGKGKATLTETVRAWREPYGSLKPPVFPLPHPSWRNNAWIVRNCWFERELLPVLRAAVARLVS
jgi:uracil-DNA glycosylase